PRRHDPDAVGRQLDGQRLGETDHTGLRRHVVGHAVGARLGADDEIVTMRPQPAASMSGTAACRQWNVPVRLTASMRSHASGLMSVKVANSSTPALVTMICTGPSSS